MLPREHQIPTAQGAARAARRPYRTSSLRRQWISLPGGRLLSAANPDRRPKQIDNVTRHASLQSSINSKCACHVASTVVFCGHTYVVSLVEIPARRKLSGIKVDLVALVVSWIDQNH